VRAIAVYCRLLAIFALAAPLAANGETLVPARHHEWGKFRPGSWKHVRVTREDVDFQGKVISTSVTETTTTLISVNERSVTLRVDTIVEIAGRQFAKQPQLVTQGFGGETEGNAVPAKTVGTQSLSIDGRQLDSEIRTVSFRDNVCQWSSRVYYCENTAPYVLRREISSTDVVNDAAKYETTVDVVAIDQPIDVKGEAKKASQIRTVHTTPKSKTITLEHRCEDVPGGYVSHTSEQLDSDGQLVARSKLELVDYYVRPKDENTRVEYRQVWPRWYYRRWGR
jgi:hypothetical protein